MIISGVVISNSTRRNFLLPEKIGYLLGKPLVPILPISSSSLKTPSWCKFNVHPVEKNYLRRLKNSGRFWSIWHEINELRIMCKVGSGNKYMNRKEVRNKAQWKVNRNRLAETRVSLFNRWDLFEQRTTEKRLVGTYKELIDHKRKSIVPWWCH